MVSDAASLAQQPLSLPVALQTGYATLASQRVHTGQTLLLEHPVPYCAVALQAGPVHAACRSRSSATAAAVAVSGGDNGDNPPCLTADGAVSVAGTRTA